MRKNLLQLIPATLLLFCTACQATAPQPPLQESYFQDYVQSEEFSERENKRNTPSNVWDTSTVDISEIPRERKLISFTFDDAPSRTLERILAIFASFNEKHPDYKASATVFFNGGLFDGQTKHLLYAAYALGFELGNHTQSHADLTTLNAERLHTEIDRTDELLAEIDGQPRHLLRAPFGKISPLVKEIAPAPLIDWTIDTLDWTGVSANEIYERIYPQRFPGAIVLMHDGYEHTLSALKRLLPDLAADGYQVVSVSKMIKAHECTFRNGGVYIRARKQN